jgi:hypothetical protein
MALRRREALTSTKEFGGLQNLKRSDVVKTAQSLNVHENDF